MDALDPIIATRVFDLDGDSTVRVDIEAPNPDGQDYRCRYRITGLDDQVNRQAMGIDSMQALKLAMTAISTRLYASDAWRQGRLHWLAQTDLGLPAINLD